MRGFPRRILAGGKNAGGERGTTCKKQRKRRIVLAGR